MWLAYWIFGVTGALFVLSLVVHFVACRYIDKLDDIEDIDYGC